MNKTNPLTLLPNYACPSPVRTPRLRDMSKVTKTKHFLLTTFGYLSQLTFTIPFFLFKLIGAEEYLKYLKPRYKDINTHSKGIKQL